jgi:hypothetical protein
MIGVRVGIEDGVHALEACRQGLSAKVRAGVDEDNAFAGFG